MESPLHARSILRSAATFIVGLALAAGPLAAQTVSFSGHGHSYAQIADIPAGDFSFQYLLPQSPTPFSSIPDGTFDGFSMGKIVQGTTVYTDTDDLVFFTSGHGGGFAIRRSGNVALTSVGGLPLFTGPTDSPTFALGTYTGSTQRGNQTKISDVTISSTPEPTSMALLGTGLVGLVPMVRRRRK